MNRGIRSAFQVDSLPEDGEQGTPHTATALAAVRLCEFARHSDIMQKQACRSQPVPSPAAYCRGQIPAQGFQGGMTVTQRQTDTRQE